MEKFDISNTQEMNDVKSLGEVCRLADSFKDDYQNLHSIWDEFKSNKVYYTDAEFGFGTEHIKNYAVALANKRKVDKLLDDY